MKKLLSIAAIAALMAGFVSCSSSSSDDPEKEPVVVSYEISASPASATFEAEGGTVNIVVKTNAETYAVGETPAWLTAAKNGAELKLTAEANTETKERTAEVKLQAGVASVTIAVTQKPGSPYPGYVVADSCAFEYSGTMLYQFLKPLEGYDGGQAYLTFVDEDKNVLNLWIYTDLYESEDQVKLNVGTYTLGEDAYPTLVAKKMTFAKGVKTSTDDEAFVMGSFYTDAATETDIEIVDGIIEVIEEKEGLVIKAAVKDSKGNEHKYVSMGKLVVSTEGATYPSDVVRIDVANTVFAATCVYNGDKYANGTTSYTLMIYSGTEEEYAVTTYEFVAPAVEYSATADLTGMYVSPTAEGEQLEEGQEPILPYSAGSIVNGALIEMEGFSFPTGTYVMYTFGDYLVGDAYNSLMLTRGEDGKYTFMGAIMDSNNDMVFFMTPPALEIPIIDGTKVEED